MRRKGGPQNASCKYKGVRQRTWGKWVSEIRVPNGGERIWVGSFEDSTSAALAYDKAAIKIFGDTAKLNFPNKLPHVSLPDHATAATSEDTVVDQRPSAANAELNFPYRLQEASSSSSICATSVEDTADQRLSRDMLNFSNELLQMSLPVHATDSSVNANFNQEGINFSEKGIINIQQDEYPPWDEVSLIANPYACLINDHVYDYNDQFILQERLRSVAPPVDHSEFQCSNVVKNDIYRIEKRDGTKENKRVELPEYNDSSLGKIKDPGVVIACKTENVEIDDELGDLGSINFWF